MFFDELLKLETEELIDFTFTKYNFLMWPFIRRVVLEKICLRLTQSSPPVAYFDKSNVVKEVVPYTYNSFKHNPYKWSNFPIVFFTTQRTVNFKKNNKYFNRLTDYFASVYKDLSLIVERSENKVFKLPRCVDNITFEDYIYVTSYLKTLFAQPSDKDLYKIENFVKYLKKIFNSFLDEKDFISIYKKLVNHSKKYPFVYESYCKLFENLKPSVIFSVGRGSKRIYLYKAAKDMGIKVAELQHGIISKSHVLYNYSDSMINSSQFQEYLPDYFLTFGSFWNKYLRDSTKKVVIGYPHLTTSLSEIKRLSCPKFSQDKKRILIISQGTHTKDFVEIAKYLSAKLGNNIKIFYKLHPAEVLFEDRYKELYNYKNIDVFKDGNIYELFCECDCIVACYSTAILEALAFHKPIFILNNSWSKEFIPLEIGVWFSEKEELYNLLHQDSSIGEYAYDFFEKTDWRENYIKFIENEIGLSV